MTSDGPRVAAVLAVVLFLGIALRTQLAGVAPLIPRMQVAFELPYVLAGWLTAIPVVFLGVMAFAGPLVAGMAGIRAVLGVSLLLVIVFSVLRAFAGDAAVLLLTTLPIGVGIGLAGSLIPAAVRALDRRVHGPALGLFALGLELGTGGAAALAAPLALMLGGWREALLVLTVPLLVALVVWIAVWKTDGRDGGAIRSSILPRTLSALVVVFGFQAIAFHSTLTWLPARLTEVGWSEAGAGAALGLLNAVAIVGTLVVAIWCRTFQMRLVTTIGGSVALAAGLALISVDPGRTVIWAAIAGLAFGMLFPVAMTLPLDYARDSHDALRLTAGTLGFGYLLASSGSTVTGALRDLSGSFVPVFIVLAVVGLIPAFAARALRRKLPLGPAGVTGAEASPSQGFP